MCTSTNIWYRYLCKTRTYCIMKIIFKQVYIYIYMVSIIMEDKNIMHNKVKFKLMPYIAIYSTKLWSTDRHGDVNEMVIYVNKVS